MMTLSIPLMKETRTALEILRRHWPRQFAFAASTSEEATQTVQDYARALQGCDLAWIAQAATQWVADEKFGPKPSELAAKARAIGHALNATQQATKQALDASPDLYDRAKALWYEKPGPKSGYGRLDEERAIAFTLQRGGTMAISDGEMDKIHGHQLAWGWLLPEDVPRTAAPDSFFVSWGIPLAIQGAA